MKWNDLTKQDKLLVYIYYVQIKHNRFFSYNIDGEHLIYHWDITSNIANLRDIGNQLLKKKLICYYDNTNKHTYLMLTSNGFAYATYLIKQLGDNNPFEIDFSKHKSRDFDKIADAKIAQFEQENKELRRKLAADSNTVQVQDPVEKLSLECGKLATKIIQLKEENKNLKLDLAQILDIVDSKKEIIDNLGKSLYEAYAKLDKKNKENEYLKDILEKKLDAEKKMVAWTKSIIDGNAC